LIDLAEIRLHKFLAHAGVASRRAAEELVRQGRVEVNGRKAEIGCRVDPLKDDVRVDGNPVLAAEAKIYLAFYKPRGCITSTRDPQGRQTVFDFLPRSHERIFPVGRLDYDAEGLLLLTNDGALANRLLHPRYGISKVYEVKVKGHPDPKAIERLRSGVVLEEGTTAPAGVEVIRELPRAAWLQIVLRQGWNRQIKRMCEAVGHPVIKIKRIAYGPVRLGKLRPGDFRPLRPGELERMVQSGPNKEQLVQ
jgi:23S rRNA pseudouridine2605 synthase